MADSQTAERITVLVNGEPQTLPAGSTLQSLMMSAGFPEQGVAVAVNRTVIPRSAHATHVLQDGDALDVVQAVGGG